MNNLSTVLLIPPNGSFKKQDFSLQRIAKWFNSNSKLKIILLHIEDKSFSTNLEVFNNIICVQDAKELYQKIHEIDYQYIFHRSWMGAYSFASKIVAEFDNVIVNIKDWNFAEQEVYEFLYPESKDFEAIEYIFKNAKLILSHFTQEQANLWASEYSCDQNKFIFFPEFCNPNSFISREYSYHRNTINLVYAGKIPSTNLPEDYFPGKSHLRSIKQVSNDKVSISFVLPPSIYKDFFVEKKKYMDFIYESEMNEYFNLLSGGVLDSRVLNNYHFGFFELETTGKNTMLYKYAVTSKFAFYLESGLPLLVNEKFEAMACYVEKYKLGIVFSNSDLENMGQKLKITDDLYNSYIDNIKQFRINFIYDDNLLKTIGLLR